MGGRSKRAARILQGGLPLPVVFRDMVRYLMENGRSAPEYALVKVVRGALEDLHGNRVASYWGSEGSWWEALTTDLLEEMEERGVVRRDEGAWSLTKRIRQGARFRPMSEVRITVYSRAEEARREAFAYARARAISYQAYLEEKGIFSGEVAETFRGHLDSLTWEEGMPEEEEEPPPPLPERKYGDVINYIREYMAARPEEWVTAKNLAAIYNEAHPHQVPVRPSSAWNRMQQMVWQGQVERRDGRSPGPGRNHTEFRWKEEE